MNTSFESIATLLVILPGFLASSVLRALQERREVSAFVQFMEALAFSFVIQVIVASFGMAAPIVTVLGDDKQITGTEYRPWSILLAIALAIVLPSALSFLIERDLLLRPARHLKLTTRTGRASTWLDVFGDHANYIIVHFKDGTRAMGWPYQYSDKPEEGMIYLTDPIWVDDNDKYVEMNAEGLFICNRVELSMITIVPNEED